MAIQLLTLTLLLLAPPEPASLRLMPDLSRVQPTPIATPRIGALGITGATMTTASLAVFIAGRINLETGPYDNRFDREVRHTRPSDRALVGLGVVGIVAGLTALVFDLELRQRALRIHADATPTSGGVWLTGRF